MNFISTSENSSNFNLPYDEIRSRKCIITISYLHDIKTHFCEDRCRLEKIIIRVSIKIRTLHISLFITLKK